MTGSPYTTSRVRSMLAQHTDRCCTPLTGPGTPAFIGLADLPWPGVTDHDYQDLGVRITAAPEPASLALIGTALAGCRCYAGGAAPDLSRLAPMRCSTPIESLIKRFA